MKFFLIILISVLTTVFSFGNTIDSIQTKIDVNKFLIEKVDTGFIKEEIFDTTIVDVDKYGKNNFFKLDLDGNGLTDLLINGKYLFAVVDLGKGKYKVNFIDRATFMMKRFTIQDIVNLKEQPIIIIIPVQTFPFNPQKIKDAILDTLIYKFGNFIEYSSNTKHYLIQKIEFSTTMCYGTCPVFDIKINSDRKGVYDAKEYNDRKGKFKTIIDTSAFNNLVALLNYVDFPKLKDEYSVGWTDDQTSYLKIYYNNGQAKIIRDYGLVGTFGLASVYDILFKLRTTQNWK